jgi:hypothetical protein
MLAKSQQIQLFACCLPVKGHRRSLICDVQREKIHFIPNSLYGILIKSKAFSFNDLKKDIEPPEQETLSEYLNFLIDNELAFKTQGKRIKKSR